MNDQDLYGKTAAGFEEVRGRALKLPQRLRTMLIMVDGTRTVAQLRDAAQTLAAPEDFLQLLQGMGLVALEGTAPVRGGSPSSAGLVVQAPAAATAPPAAPAVVTVDVPVGSVTVSGEKFRAALKFMNDSAVDLLGLRAFFFTLKLEKCYTPQDLLALLPDFSKAIAKSNGPEMARALEDRARQMLSD
jgi:hypothetical protein